jgi:hypothetical protein
VTSWAAAVDAARTTAAPAMNVERMFSLLWKEQRACRRFSLIYSFEYNRGGADLSQLRIGAQEDA